MLAQFQSGLRQLPSLEQPDNKGFHSHLWRELEANLLLSSTQLGEKYSKMEKDEETAQVKGIAGLNERKITE